MSRCRHFPLMTNYVLFCCWEPGSLPWRMALTWKQGQGQGCSITLIFINPRHMLRRDGSNKIGKAVDKAETVVKLHFYGGALIICWAEKRKHSATRGVHVMEKENNKKKKRNIHLSCCSQLQRRDCKINYDVVCGWSSRERSITFSLRRKAAGSLLG